MALLPLLLLFYSCLLPPEIRLTLGGQTIYAPRLISMLLLPISMYALFQGRVRFNWGDALVLVGSLWMIVSFIALYGPSEGTLRGSGLVIDVLFPFLIARTSIKDIQDLRRVFVLLVPGLAVVAGFLAIESLSHKFIVRPLAMQIFGALPSAGVGPTSGGMTTLWVEYRLGMMRAYGPFSHPILGGVTMSSLLAPFFLSKLRGWPWTIGCLTALSGIFSTSSAVYLVLIISVAAIAFDYAQRQAQIPAWKYLIVVSIVLIGLIELTSNSGVAGITARLTINPQSAYFRRLIWEFGSQSVINHPLFGIGYEEYERAAWMGGTSVDHYWLLLAMRHGVVTSFCLLGASVYILLRVGGAGTHASEADRQFCVGIAIALFAFVLSGFTVALFGSAQAWFFAFLGAAATVSDVTRRNAAVPSSGHPAGPGPTTIHRNPYAASTATG